jgi:hypothetical protein
MRTQESKEMRAAAAMGLRVKLSIKLRMEVRP